MPKSTMQLTVLLVVMSAVIAASLSPQDDLKLAPLGDFRLESGEVIRDCRIGYRTFGTLNATKSNALLFPTWFTGTTELLKPLTGPGKLADTSKYYVILVDSLGDGLSSSPSNSTLQPQMRFPKFTIRDMVEAEHVLVTEVLHLHHLRAVLGISMGGMQTFQWIVAYPTFMDKAIPIMGSPRLTSYDLLLWTAQERAIEEDPAWNGGAYREPPAAGMRTAADILALNLYTPAYRVEHTTPSEFPQFLAKTEDDTLKLFDANNWIRQLQAMMAQDVAKPFRGSMEQAATAVRAEVMIIVGTQDHIVNPDPATAFGNLLKARVMRLESDCGHLSIFCQEEMMSAETTKFLAP